LCIVHRALNLERTRKIGAGVLRRLKWIWRHRKLVWQYRRRIVGAIVICTLFGYYFWQGALDRSQDAVIAAAARRYDMDGALIKAVMWRESRFNPRARGTKGEVGLMQLREEAGREWARAEGLGGYDHRQMTHPGRNAMAGAWYLRKQLLRYALTDNPTPYALAAYNAGPSNVAKWAKGEAATNSALFVRAIGFPVTQRYVQRVMEQRERYARSGAFSRQAAGL
jgi:soluble lytic murein transglycosylase